MFKLLIRNQTYLQEMIFSFCLYNTCHPHSAYVPYRIFPFHIDGHYRAVAEDYLIRWRT